MSESVVQEFLLAPTTAERLARVHDWLDTHPDLEMLQSVLKELGKRDKGTSKPVRERLEQLKAQQHQAWLMQEWQASGHTLLQKEHLSIAEGLAWMRDAAQAKAPLSKEPLNSLRAALQQRIDAIEDLQNQVAVQKEAALLLVQRIETYSTQPWQQADAAQTNLETDIQVWLQKKDILEQMRDLPSIDTKYSGVLQQSAQQLRAVWQAFDAALVQARIAAADSHAALPPVPIWAEAIRHTHELTTQHAQQTEKLTHQTRRNAAQDAVCSVLVQLENELASGHGKASVENARQLREVLRQNEGLLEANLRTRAQSALAAAGELLDWQRWHISQTCQKLIQQAQALAAHPLPPKKQQASLRQLRDAWKQTDQNGVPDHHLWKVFDHACAQAYQPVQAWLSQLKETEQANYAQRKALIEELTAQSNGIAENNWRAQLKLQRNFEMRWREAGHVSEKMYAELLPLWKAAMQTTFAALANAQRQSIALRKTLIAESENLTAQTPLSVPAIKALQERWRKEAQSVPLNRHQEQTLWERFNKPIDTAFAQKHEQAKQRKAAQHNVEQQVQAAINALHAAASRSSDAQAIYSALQTLEAATSTTTAQQLQTLDTAHKADTTIQPAASVESVPEATPVTPAEGQDGTGHNKTDLPSATPADIPQDTSETAPEAVFVPKSTAKKVVAVRGDDRPKAQKSALQKPASNTKARANIPPAVSNNDTNHSQRKSATESPARIHLSDSTWQALRSAREQAYSALKTLQRQAHGQQLLQLLAAWKSRDSTQLPKLSELSKKLNPAHYQDFAQAIDAQAIDTQASDSQAGAKALLRLEILHNLPSPAAYQNERRMEQLQMLTRKNQDLSWQNEVCTILGSTYNENHAHRLQALLKRVL